MNEYDPIAAGALCTECPLYGEVVVPPKGPPFAGLAIVGEGPGYNEVKKGEPFVGASGVALNAYLRGAGLERSQVFVSNAVLCRADTPGVEGQKRYEMKTYLAWLRKENAAEKRDARAAKRPAVLKKTPLECCRPRLLAELAYLDRVSTLRGQPNGLIVMPLGNFASAAITDFKNILKIRGSVFPVEVAT